MNRKSSQYFALGTGISSLVFGLKGKPKWATFSAVLALGSLILMPRKFSVHGKSVVITGGSRGFGLAMAQIFLQKQAKVTLLARSEEELLRARHLLLGQLGTDYDKQLFVQTCDVTDSSQISKALTEIQTRFSTVDVFINNAGSMLMAPFETLEQEDFEAQYRIHLLAAVKTTQQLIPIFRKQKRGHIVNICSLGGKIALPHMSAHCASKFALAGFSKASSAELRKSNIRVMTVYPSAMKTGSSSQAVFKGNHAKEFAWLSFLERMPGFSASPESVAKRIFVALENGETEVVVPFAAKWLQTVSGIFPELFLDFLSLLNRLLPTGQSRQRRTGAASQNWIHKQAWTRSLSESLHRAQDDYNQVDSYDARFNLNLKS